MMTTRIDRKRPLFRCLILVLTLSFLSLLADPGPLVQSVHSVTGKVSDLDTFVLMYDEHGRTTSPGPNGYFLVNSSLPSPSSNKGWRYVGKGLIVIGVTTTGTLGGAAVGSALPALGTMAGAIIGGAAGFLISLGYVLIIDAG